MTTKMGWIKFKIRRNRVAILVEMLDTLRFKGELSKTQFFSYTELSGKLYREYLETLLAEELIKKRKIGKVRMYFSIAEKGREFLDDVKANAVLVRLLG